MKIKLLELFFSYQKTNSYLTDPHCRRVYKNYYKCNCCGAIITDNKDNYNNRESHFRECKGIKYLIEELVKICK